MKKTVVCCLLLILSLWFEINSYAQNIGLMGNAGIATVQMDDMKSLQSYILGTYPVEGQVISSFPPYASTSVHLVKQLNPQFRIGAGYTFTSTGGKTDYTDYSGFIHTTIITNSNRIGAYVSYSIWDNDLFEFAIFGKLDANFSHVEVTSSIYAAGLSNYAINNYKSISPNALAGLEFFYKFNDFTLGIDAGYLADLPAELKNKEGGSSFYDPSSRTRILTTDWSGYRANIKAIFWLKPKSDPTTF